MSEEYIIEGVTYGCPDKDTAESLKEAAILCYWAIDDNIWSPSKIICPDGRIIRGDEFDRLLKQYEDSGYSPEWQPNPEHEHVRHAVEDAKRILGDT